MLGAVYNVDIIPNPLVKFRPERRHQRTHPRLVRIAYPHEMPKFAFCVVLGHLLRERISPSLVRGGFKPLAHPLRDCRVARVNVSYWDSQYRRMSARKSPLRYSALRVFTETMVYSAPRGWGQASRDQLPLPLRYRLVPPRSGSNSAKTSLAVPPYDIAKAFSAYPKNA